MTLLFTTVLSRIRRNHGLEHATLNLLAQQFPSQRMAGYSYVGGFFIVGHIPTADLHAAILQALARMKNGERGLAIHAQCGTNYAVSGLIGGLLAWLGMTGTKSKRDKVERLPLVIALATLGFILSQPLGLVVQQRITTSGDPQNMEIVNVLPIRLGQLTLHRVVTQG